MKINYRKVLAGLCIALTVAIAFLTGVYLTEYKTLQESKKSTVSTIAVVNMDNGVMKNGELVHYSEDMMQFPDVNFMPAGLVDAREGAANGKYAAYILLPENFSAAIESINTEPQKSSIEYAIYPDLREDINIKVINDIHNFIINLSSNTSYMYVNAILREFHSVQDGSGTILVNDTRDLNQLMAVAPEELLQPIEFTPMERVENTIEYIDLSDQYKKAEKIVADVDKNYEKYVQTGRDEIKKIQQKEPAVTASNTALTEKLATITIDTDAEGKLIYAEGMEELNQAAQEYAAVIDGQKKTAKVALGWVDPSATPTPTITPTPEITTTPGITPTPEVTPTIIPTPTPVVNATGLQTYVTNQFQTVADTYNTKIDTQINALNNTKTSLTTLRDNNIDIEIAAQLETQITAIDGITVELLTAKITDTVTDQMRTDLDEWWKNAIHQIDAIETIDTSNIQGIISEKISAPVRDQCSKERAAVMDGSANLQKALGDYVIPLLQFDPMMYVDQGEIAKYMGELSETVYDMETETLDKTGEYIDYSMDVYDTADKNIEALQEDVDTSYTQTEENVTRTVTDLKANREKINAQNSLLLEDFVTKLPYSRLGSIEYTEVYDLIVSPLNAENHDGNRHLSLKDIDEQAMEYIGLGIILTVITMLVCALVCWIYQIRTEAKKSIQGGGEKDEWSRNFN